MFEPWWYLLLFGVAVFAWGRFAWTTIRELRTYRLKVERELWDEKYWPEVRDR